MSDELFKILKEIEKLCNEAYWLACSDKLYDLAASLECKCLEVARLRGYDGD